MSFGEAAQELKTALRLKTEPLGVAFLREASGLPEKSRRPSQVFGKRVTICQGVTLARVYGWPVGLTAQDLICVPGMLAFGLAPEPEPTRDLAALFCEVGFHPAPETALREAEALCRLAPGEIAALYLAPLERLALEPEVIVVYGNPAQLMRLVQAVVYALEERVTGRFGGKVECTSYLIAPYKTGRVHLAIPGLGDRIFSMTQDEELVLSFPRRHLEAILKGLAEAARKIGARYPITFYQNFQPEFPPPYKERAKKWGIG